MAPEIFERLRRLKPSDAHRLRLQKKSARENLPRAPLILRNERPFAIKAWSLSLWFLSSRRPLLAGSTRLCEQPLGRQHSCNRPSPACLAESPTMPRCDLLGQEWSCLWYSNTAPGPGPPTNGT